MTHPPYASYPMASFQKLFDDLAAAERARYSARAAIINEIRRRLGDMSAYAFAVAAGINKGNFYNLLTNHKWNGTVVSIAVDLLDSPISDAEVKGREGSERPNGKKE